MAILYMEGFDGYANEADFIARDGVSGDLTGFVSGRINGSASNHGYLEDVICVIPETTATQWVVCAVWPVSYGSTTTPIMEMQNAGTAVWGIYPTGGSPSYAFKIGGDTGTQLGSSFTITPAQWNVIEATVFVNDTTGTVLVKVDGTEVINLTSQDTKAGTPTTGDNYRFGAVDPGQYYYDDLVIGDDSGTDQTTSPGDVHIEQLLPDGDGTTTDFTPLSGLTNYEMVDEASADGDTTYVSSSTAAHKDLYTFGNLTGSVGTVYAVQVIHKTKKEVAGNRTLSETIRSNVTEVDSTAHALGTVYTWYGEGIFENDPDGGGAWDEAAVNAMECGIEIKT